MRSSSSRFLLWTTAALLVALGTGLWLVLPTGPEAPVDGGPEPATSGEPAASDGPGGRQAGDGPGSGSDLAGTDLGEGIDLSAEFEAPSTPRVHRYTLLRDDRSVGSFRAEIRAGQEGMVELRFRLRTDAGTRQGTVTTIPRLFYRYARRAVEAETESPLPLLTVLAPPALEAVLAARGDRAREAGDDEPGEAVTVAGVPARRFTATVGTTGGEVRIESVATAEDLLPLRVRTTLPDGTVLEARPPES